MQVFSIQIPHNLSYQDRTAPSFEEDCCVLYINSGTVATAVMSTHHLVIVFVMVLSVLTTAWEDYNEKVPNGSKAMRNLYTDVCGDESNKIYNGHVTCSNGTVTVNRMFCLTHNHCPNNSRYRVVAGACPFSARTNASSYSLNLSSIDECKELNDDVFCKNFNRSGRLCGECAKNYSLAINSYSLECKNSSACSAYNWLLLVIIYLAPVAIFFIVIIVFHINITSGYANAYILYAQLVSMQINAMLLQRDWEVVMNSTITDPKLAYRISMALVDVYSVWNLDFGQSILPSVCVIPGLGNMAALALEYLNAVFGLVLIITVYVLVELHARNVRLVVWLWRPFRMCFSRFQRQLKAKTSLIDAFATFLFLSYSKFALTSIMLLTPTKLFNRTGSVVDLVLLYDGTVDYFGTRHLPLAVVAIIVVIIFVLLPPVAMILYPFKCVQRCLTRCRLHHPALVAFMDAIQGCYKDGTNNTYDLRFCSAVYFLSRVVVFTMYAALAFEYYQQLQYCLLFIPLSLIVFVAVVRPYKKDLYNSLDITMFVFFIIVASSCLYSSNEGNRTMGFQVCFYILLFIPFLFFVSYVCWRIFLNRCISYCARKYSVSAGAHSLIGHFSRSYLRRFSHCSMPRSSLPNRVLQPEDYEVSELSHDGDSYGTML